MHGADVFISDVQTIETTLYYWRSDNAWRRSFNQWRSRHSVDVFTMHGDDVLISNVQSIERMFY